MTKMLINLILLGVLLGFGEAKICWEECEANNVVQVEITRTCTQIRYFKLETAKATYQN